MVGTLSFPPGVLHTCEFARCGVWHLITFHLTVAYSDGGETALSMLEAA